MKVVTSQQMRNLEKAAEEQGISTDQLMENAGIRVAEKAREMLDGTVKGEHITVLVGPGNNGGDGLVAARHLNEWGARVHIALCAPRRSGDPKLEGLRDRAVHVFQVEDEAGGGPLGESLASARLVIDAVLGTGHRANRTITGAILAGLEEIESAQKQRSDLRVLALDVPSGLDADTGECDPATPSADVTITLGFPKVGLFVFPGAATVGRLEVVDIGIPADLAAGIDLALSSPDWVRSLLPARPAQANKGTFGRVLVVAGSARYIGAAFLACAGAIRSGAGLVSLATARSLVPVVASALPEVTYIPLDEEEWGVVSGADSARRIHEELPGYDAILVGCGLGHGPQASELVQRLLLDMPENLAPRVVIDADGLNILALVDGWWERMRADTVVTPHPGEMGRLTGLAVHEIQAKRLDTAREAAARWGKTVLLKGAYTVVAAPEGNATINPFANPGMATAGTGDVLAGIIAGMLAQGLPGFQAAAAAAYVHGAAGEAVREDLGDAGMAASDLLPAIPKVMKGLRA